MPVRGGSLRAELIMVGTELLLGQIVDTNAAYLAQQLARCGINVYHKTTVGDNWTRLAAVLGQALNRADIIITSGGLGPTEDDLTKEVLAAVVGRDLVLDEEALAHLESWFSRQGRVMPERNRKQVMLPRGAQAIPNQWGTAPGVLLELGDQVVVCLPGVPRELRGMMETTVLPFLEKRYGAQGVIRSRTLRFCGIGESQLEELVRPLLASSNPTVAPYAGTGEVKLRVTAKAASEEEAWALIEPVQREIERLAGEWLYGYDDDTLEAVVARLLLERGRTLAVAESCTGGLITHRLTDIPGASGFLREGLVTYSNEAKMELLGVSPETLGKFGAVSPQCAREMALGARRRARTDYAVATTGIAGPGGGTPEKPVGLVYLAVAAAESGAPGDGQQPGERVYLRRIQVVGERERVKHISAQTALDGLRRVVLGGEVSHWELIS